MQVPLPSQIMQFPQVLPKAGKEQAPAPLQDDPQGPVPLVHSPSGSAPATVGLQRPARPVWLQDRQVPLQSLLQQTPSAQWPEAQALSLAQAVPFLLLQAPVPSHA